MGNIKNTKERKHKLSFLQVFNNWFFTSKIGVIQGIPFAMIWIGLLGLILAVRIFNIADTRNLSFIWIIYSLMLCILIAVVGVIRREFWISRFNTLKGSSASSVGIFLAVFCTVLVIIFIISGT